MRQTPPGLLDQLRPRRVEMRAPVARIVTGQVK
jgi:hypothetical protein